MSGCIGIRRAQSETHSFTVGRVQNCQEVGHVSQVDRHAARKLRGVRALQVVASEGAGLAWPSARGPPTCAWRCSPPRRAPSMSPCKGAVRTAQALNASNRREIRLWRCTRSPVAIFCRILEISGVRGLLRPSCACRATGTFSTSSRPSATFCFPDRAQHHRCPPRLLAVVQILVLIATVLAVHMASSL